MSSFAVKNIHKIERVLGHGHLHPRHAPSPNFPGSVIHGNEMQGSAIDLFWPIAGVHPIQKGPNPGFSVCTRVRCMPSSLQRSLSGVQFFTPILQHSFQFVFRKIILNMCPHEVNFLRMVPKKVLDFVTKHRSFALKNSK